MKKFLTWMKNYRWTNILIMSKFRMMKAGVLYADF
jgi:hypothetical protein